VKSLKKKKLIDKKGFTLVELLIVMAIIGLLASIVLISLNIAKKKANDAKRLSDLKQIQIALEMYNDENGSYPNQNCSSTDSGWRDYNRSSVTEHTAFMSTEGIKEDASGYGYSLEGGQSPLRFKIDAVDSEKGDISNVSIDFSSETYKVDFVYDAESNEYLKYTAGTPHTDFDTGKQISVNNVIVMITNIDGPIDESGHMVVRTTGAGDNGKAFFFLDGNVIEGTWERNSIFEPFTFRDEEGNIVLFNRGSTWVSMIQTEERLSY